MSNPHVPYEDPPDDTAALSPAVAAALAGALAPIAPAPGRAEAILARTLERVRADAAQPAPAPTFITLRAGTEGWVELLPKVHAKRLYTDGKAESYLVRMEPGARAPAHDHPDYEECLVLEGSVRYVGAETLNVGDFQVAERGAHHSELVSESGALVFLRYNRPVAEYIGL